jgi:hypothetical protein
MTESVKSQELLSLSEALASGQLSDFIDRQEAAGVGVATEADFDAMISAAVRPRQSTNQTSRSS